MQRIFRSLLRRKVRTFLTVFGITIGIMALTVMGAFAEKINKLNNGATQFLENRIFIIEKGQSLFTASGGIIPKKLATDVAKVEGVACVQNFIELNVKADQGISFGQPNSVEGIDVSQFQDCGVADNFVANLSFASGAFWEAGTRGVAVLGADVAEEYGKKLGDEFEVRGKKLKVVGVLERILTSPDKFVFTDIRDAREMLVASRPSLKAFNAEDIITSIFAIPAAGQDADIVTERIKQQVPDATAISPTEIKKQIQQFSTIFNSSILGMALLSLIVGGLSVINTMVMSVSERQREIGIKIAVGARPANIVREYLLESVIIGALGGLVGLGIGWLITFLINAKVGIAAQVFLLTPRLAIFSFVFAVFLGAMAGLYPAIRASRTDPVKVLRSL